MAEYLFQNAAGEIRTITRSMRSPPPERLEEDGQVWERVWVPPQVSVRAGSAVGYKPSADNPIGCASQSLPPNDSPFEVVNRDGHRVRSHQDGTYSTMDGRRIIDSQRAVDAAKRDGYVKE